MTQTATANATANAKHPFELSGLGIAPFRFLGYSYSVGPIQLPDGSKVGAPGQAMGSCSHCLTGISHIYNIESSDGIKSTIGSVCVERLYSESGYTDSLIIAVRKAKKDADRKARKAREKRQLLEMESYYSTHETLLRSMLVPFGTLWERTEWFSNNAGTSGKLRTFRAIKKAISEMSNEERRSRNFGGK